MENIIINKRQLHRNCNWKSHAPYMYERQGLRDPHYIPLTYSRTIAFNTCRIRSWMQVYWFRIKCRVYLAIEVQQSPTIRATIFRSRLVHGHILCVCPPRVCVFFVKFALSRSLDPYNIWKWKYIWFIANSCGSRLVVTLRVRSRALFLMVKSIALTMQNH